MVRQGATGPHGDRVKESLILVCVEHPLFEDTKGMKESNLALVCGQVRSSYSLVDKSTSKECLPGYRRRNNGGKDTANAHHSGGNVNTQGKKLLPAMLDVSVRRGGVRGQ